MKIIITAVLAAAVAFGGCNQPPASKQPDHNTMDHSKMDHSNMGHGDESSPGAAQAPRGLQFIDTMIVHHQGAVDMALLAETRAGRSEIKTFAAKIIEDQRKEIEQMRQMRTRSFGNAAPAINMAMPGMKDGMTGMDLVKLRSQKGNDFDLEFIRQMIPHHQGAVVMASEMLESDDNDDLNPLCREMIKAQTAEIEQMRAWSSDWSK